VHDAATQLKKRCDNTHGATKTKSRTYILKMRD